jgi:thioredoxin-related protein
LKFIFIISIVLFSLTTKASSLHYENTTWNAVIEKAKKENKPIFVFLHTTWCGKCKVMERTIFLNDTITQYFNEHFINYSIDAETKEGISIANIAKANAYPTLYFYNAKEGKVLSKSVGAIYSVSKLLAFAETAFKKEKNTSSLLIYQEQFNQQKNDTFFLKKYIEKLTELDEPNNAPLNAFIAAMNFKRHIPDDFLLYVNKHINTIEGIAFIMYYNRSDRIQKLLRKQGESPYYVKQKIQLLMDNTFEKARAVNDKPLIELCKKWLKKFEEDYGYN